MATVLNFVLGLGGPYTPPPADDIRLVLGGGGFVAPGAPLGQPLAVRWGDSIAARAGHAALPWGDAALAGSGFARVAWGRNVNTRGNGPRLPWGDASPARRGPRLPWGAAQPALAGPRLPWQRGEGAQQWARLPWQRGESAHRQARLPWQRAGAATRTARLPWGAALLVIAPNRPLPRPPALRPPSGVVRWVNLRICGPLDPFRLHLRLGVDPCASLFPGATTVIPARRSYVQSHVVEAFRLPDLTPVPITDFSLSADEGSVGWTLSAQGPTDLLALLAPVAGLPARLRVVLDGLTWEFVIEGLRRDRQFASTAATITGRSASALLGEPYMPQQTYLNTVPMTAEQIVQDALQFTGVSVDWRVTDWLVPDGAWSHSGTPLSAVRRVADAIGALVQSPRTGEAVIVAPRYPALPWDWATETPDVVLASMDPVVSDGFERADRPAYEGVYVSGQAQGVLALVKRLGTAPSVVMPMVTDALVTHLDAARQRGESLLGATGPMANITMTLPILTGSGEPGVIDPGKLVEVPDPAGTWRGLVRSVRVTYARPSLVQTLTLERHL